MLGKPILSKIHSLITIEDVLPLDKHADGYIVAKHEALMINDQYWDFAAAHSSKKTDLPYFYNIPILTSPKNTDEDVLATAKEQYQKTGLERFLVRTPESNKPFLVDVVNSNFIITTAYATNYDVFATQNAKEFTKLKQEVDGILRELGSL